MGPPDRLSWGLRKGLQYLGKFRSQSWPRLAVCGPNLGCMSCGGLAAFSDNYSFLTSTLVARPFSRLPGVDHFLLRRFPTGKDSVQIPDFPNAFSFWAVMCSFSTAGRPEGAEGKELHISVHMFGKSEFRKHTRIRATRCMFRANNHVWGKSGIS